MLNLVSSGYFFSTVLDCDLKLCAINPIYNLYKVIKLFYTKSTFQENIFFPLNAGFLKESLRYF